MLKVLIPDTMYLEWYRDAFEMQGFFCLRLTQAGRQVFTKPYYYFPFSVGQKIRWKKCYGSGQRQWNKAKARVMFMETKKNKYFILYLPSASYVWLLPLKQGFSTHSVFSWRQTSELLETLSISLCCVTVPGTGIRGAVLVLFILYHTHHPGVWGAVSRRECWGIKSGTFFLPSDGRGVVLSLFKYHEGVLFLLLASLRRGSLPTSLQMAPAGELPLRLLPTGTAPAWWGGMSSSAAKLLSEKIAFTPLFPGFLTGAGC